MNAPQLLGKIQGTRLQLELAGFYPGKIQHIRDDPEQQMGAIANAVYSLTLVPGEFGIVQ
jgi:hypothetical protein